MASAATKYGKLWGRGYETFKSRRILSVSGTADHATTYLQGLVTSDLTSEPRAPREEEEDTFLANRVRDPQKSHPGQMEEEVPIKFTSKMRFTCFLDHRGRILTDAILWKRIIDGAVKSTTEYLIDVPSDTADMLFDHLKEHKLRRSKITLQDKSDDISVHAVYGTLNAEGAPPGYLAAMDPRHPSLGMRILSVGPEAMVNGDNSEDEADSNDRIKRTDHFSKLMNNFFPHTPGTYSVLRRLSGIAEGSEITSRTALECNQEFLNAISFRKGCYLGQELTARSQFTGVVRKRILPVMIVDTEMELPRPWIMAGMIQELGEKDGVEKIFGLTKDEKGNVPKLVGHIPPPLPKMSAAGAGSLISMMMGSFATMPAESNPQEGAEEDLGLKETEAELQKLREAGEKLQNEISELAVPGASIIDKKDGKTIGKVVSEPAPGTTVILAQMRLDRLGLLGGSEKWSRTNKILIGDGSKEYRYLPYLPLWWPDIDSETGKEKEKKIDDELYELPRSDS
ncbi:hypothetical protein ACHAWO_001955 [Cyclotella atomus]|uniref:Aminomethyltransferase folate-binding domain-containing protein n=1 Tax=Cyclotella atomus TaxID=382360 RepID=A0ABD3NJB7_9STRA